MGNKNVSKYLFKPIFMLLIFNGIALFGCKPDRVYEHDYIAHAGGSVDGFMYTNSLEAVQSAIDKGMRYIELDLALTSDNQLVACHGWTEDGDWDQTPTYKEFMSLKVYNRFTPIDAARIDSILRSNPQVYLVTDKISDPQIINTYFSQYNSRVWIECFSYSDYFELMNLGYNVMMSKRPPTLLSAIKGVIKHHSFKDLYIGNYAFRYDENDNWYKRLGRSYAIFGDDISRSDANEIFEKDERVRFVYIDNME